MLTAADKELNAFLCSLEKFKGVDLSSYRENFLQRRLRSRMIATKSESLFHYLRILKKEPDEYKRFLGALSINVTEFFRDPDVFDLFRKNCLKDVIEKKEACRHEIIRIWSAACASGEEAYSLAIIITEELKTKIDNFKIRIWGTDIDKDALEDAKNAEYGPHSLKEVGVETLNRCFTNAGEGLYRLNGKVKEIVKFTQHNLITDAPLKYLDAIFCRNVMIYLKRQQQESLFENFYNALNPKGYLVIGKVESILGAPKDLFIPVDLNKKIFQKRR